MQLALSTYFQDLGSLPPPDREEEARLLSALAADPDGPAAGALVERNLRFVVSVASRYKNRGIPLEDLISEGNIGLIEATKHFEPQRGVRFITCAVWWIRRSILRSLEDRVSLVRVPPYQVRKRRSFGPRPAATARPRHHGPAKSPAGEEAPVAARLPLGIFGLHEPASLDEPAHPNDSRPLRDSLSDGGRKSPEACLLKRELVKRLQAALQSLSPRDLGILTARYGLDGQEPQTLAEVGDRFRLSRERVRQIESTAHDRLRTVLLPRESSHAVHIRAGSP